MQLNRNIPEEDIEVIIGNNTNKYTSIYENSSQNQGYKLELNHILHKPNAPFIIFGGIFATFGIDKETGQKYYNYLDIVKQQEEKKRQQEQLLLKQQQELQQIISDEQQDDQLNNKEMMTVNVLNSLLLRKIN